MPARPGSGDQRPIVAQVELALSGPPYGRPDRHRRCAFTQPMHAAGFFIWCAPEGIGDLEPHRPRSWNKPAPMRSDP